MIKRLLFLGLSILIFSFGTVKAEEGDITFGASVGEAGIVGSGMSSYGTNGFGFGGFVSYGVSYLFDMDMNIVYAPHSNGNNKATSLYFTPALKFLFQYDQIIPFFSVGVGFYHNSVTYTNTNATATSFGFNFGGGLDVKMGKYFILGLVMRYHPVFDKEAAPGVPGVADFWDAMFRIGVNFNTGAQSGWD